MDQQCLRKILQKMLRTFSSDVIYEVESYEKINRTLYYF